MSDRGVVRGTRRRSISESGPPRLSSTSIDDDLVFNDNDLSGTRNNLSHQSQQIVSSENPEGFIESPMWVGAGTRLQVWKLPANRDLETVILNKFKVLKTNISKWQQLIEYEPITFEGFYTDSNVLKGDIKALYQEALYTRVTDKLSYDIIGEIALIDPVKSAAQRLIQVEAPINVTMRVNDIVTSDVRECLSKS